MAKAKAARQRQHTHAGRSNVAVTPVQLNSGRPKVYLTSTQLRARYGGRSHMWIERRLKADPNFPKPTTFGTGRLRFWDLDEVEAYERACAAEAV